jgi:hypothetical protein
MPEVGLVSGIAEWVNDEGVVFAHFPGMLERGEQYPQSLPEMVRFLYVEQCKVVNAGCMFRRSVLSDSPEPFDKDARMSIDWQFFLHLAHRWKFYGLHQVVVRMYRGVRQDHLTARKDLQFQEARRCIRKVYEMYGEDGSSPIDLTLYRHAMSTQLVLEGRSTSRFRGMLKLIQAIAFHPQNKKAWNSLHEIFMRGLSKLRL